MGYLVAIALGVCIIGFVVEVTSGDYREAVAFFILGVALAWSVIQLQLQEGA